MNNAKNNSEKKQLLVEKTPRQCVKEICNVSERTLSRVLNNPSATDKHGIRQELLLYLEHQKKYIQTRKHIRTIKIK
jgi:hypothetical protein